MVVMEVSMIGRSLFEAKFKNSCLFVAFFKKSIMMIPSFTTTPASPTIPRAPGIVKFKPIIRFPTRTPKTERGMVDNTIRDKKILSNIQTSAMKIKNIAIKAA